MNILSNFYNNRYRNKKWEKNKGVCTPFYSLNLFRQSLASAVSNLSSEKNSDSLIPNASQIYNMSSIDEKNFYDGISKSLFIIKLFTSSSDVILYKVTCSHHLT